MPHFNRGRIKNKKGFQQINYFVHSSFMIEFSYENSLPLARFNYVFDSRGNV